MRVCSSMLRLMIRQYRPRKYMSSDLSLEKLIENRNVLKNRISLLKIQYLRRNLSGPKYYKQFESVALEMIQINQQIKEEIPSFNVLNLTSFET